MSEAYQRGFRYGLGFAVGVKFARIAKDEHIPDNDVTFRTAENGKIYAMSKSDPEKKSGLGGVTNATSLKELYGNEFTGINLTGAKAINLLRQTQRGHVKAAFYHPNIGDIDLIWGDDKSGLKHIIQQRQANHQSVDEVLGLLPEIFKKGVLIERNDPRESNNFYIEYSKGENRYKVVITKTSVKAGNKNKVHYVFTAMEFYKKMLKIKKNKRLVET